MFSDRWKIVSAAGFSLAVVVSSVSVSLWIYSESKEVQLSRILDNKRLNSACHICFTYDVSAVKGYSCGLIEKKCRSEGWSSKEKLPPSCEKDPVVTKFVEREVHRIFQVKTREFQRDALNAGEQAFLRSAEESFYAPGRSIIHWSPDVTAWNVSDHGEKWQSIKEFVKERSIFTISPGKPNSFDEGKVQILETGMYMIYARLTFACHAPDHHRTKRVHMEIVVHEESQYHFVILKDSQSATCNTNGDLVTLFQSGIFRLGEGEKIELRYRAPNGVSLTNEDWLYKSSIGLIRIGLA